MRTEEASLITLISKQKLQKYHPEDNNKHFSNKKIKLLEI